MTAPADTVILTWPQLASRAGWALFRMLCFGVIVGFIYLFGNAMRYHSYSPDDPWMFAAGEFIWRHHALPTHDFLSWTYPHRHWVLYQWLFEWVLALGKQALGMNHWLRFFTVLMFGLYVIWPVLRDMRRGVPFLWTALIATACAFLASVNLGVRPMVITSLGLALQFILIKQLRAEKISFKTVCFLLILLYCLWGNMHMGVSLGIVSLFIFAIGDWIARRWKYDYEPTDDPLEGKIIGFKSYFILIIIGFTASLINPYGIGIWGYLLNLSGNEHLNSAISELSSPDFHLNYYWVLWALIGGFYLLLQNARRCLALQDILLFLAFLMATLYSQRFVVWFALYAAFILPCAVYNIALALGEKTTELNDAVAGFERFKPLLLGATGLAMLGYLFVPHHLLVMQRGACEDLIPGIRAYYGLALPSDHLFSTSDIGSCMLAEHPATKVFEDTRFDFYPTSFTRRIGETTMLSPKVWKPTLKRWRINTLVLPATVPLATYLSQEPVYKKLYDDKHIAIFRRASFQDQPNGG